MKRHQKPIEISASREPFDMWRLGQAGGQIHFKPNGQAVFRFDSKDQYLKYLELNKQREAMA